MLSFTESDLSFQPFVCNVINIGLNTEVVHKHSTGPSTNCAGRKWDTGCCKFAWLKDSTASQHWSCEYLKSKGFLYGECCVTLCILLETCKPCSRTSGLLLTTCFNVACVSSFGSVVVRCSECSLDKFWLRCCCCMLQAEWKPLDAPILTACSLIFCSAWSTQALFRVGVSGEQVLVMSLSSAFTPRLRLRVAMH